MRRVLRALAISSLALSAHAAPVCPQNLLQLEKLQPALALVKSFRPFVIEPLNEDQCKPQASGHIALGTPLCMFAGELPAVGMGLQSLAADERLIGASYMFDYTPEAHARLLALLRKDYQEVAPAAYPGHFANMPVHEEITALFKSGGMYVALQKPSKGMPGSWHSGVSFIEIPHLAVASRDLNSCD